MLLLLPLLAAMSKRPTRSTRNRSNSPSDASEPPLEITESFKKQLVQDILDRGGLDIFSGAKLWDDKPDIYGRANSKRRRGVQQLVTRWKNKQRDEYDRLRLSYFPPSPLTVCTHRAISCEHHKAISCAQQAISRVHKPSPPPAARRNTTKPSPARSPSLVQQLPMHHERLPRHAP